MYSQPFCNHRFPNVAALLDGADGDQVPFSGDAHSIFHGLGAGLNAFGGAEMMKTLSLLWDLGAFHLKGPWGASS